MGAPPEVFGAGSNPARTLANALERFSVLAAQADTIEQTWQKVLGTSNALEVTTSLGYLASLVGEVATLARALQLDGVAEGAAMWATAWTSAIIPRGRQFDGATGHGVVDPGALQALKMAADAFEGQWNTHPGTVGTPSSNEITALEQAIATALEQVAADDSLTKSQRSSLSHALRAFGHCVRTLDTYGPDPLADALWSLVTVLNETGSRKRRRKRGWAAAAAVAGMGYVVFSQGANIQTNAEAWMSIGEHVRDAITQVVEQSAQIEAPPAPKQIEESPDSGDIIDGEIVD